MACGLHVLILQMESPRLVRIYNQPYAALTKVNALHNSENLQSPICSTNKNDKTNILCTSTYLCTYIHRDDYKFSEMIGQKPLIATLIPNLIGHPYIVLESQCISGRTLSKMV